MFTTDKKGYRRGREGKDEEDWGRGTTKEN